MKPKILILIVAAVLATPALTFGMTSFDYPVVAPVLSFVQGDVTVKGTGAADWEVAEVGRLLASGDTVRTGSASRAEISCATGKMRLYENTVIIVPEVVDEGDKKDIRRVDLDNGTGLFRIRKRGVEKGFEVQTSNIIAGVKGTLFAVLHERVSNLSRVAVYSGVVEVIDKDRTPETSTILKRGESLEVKDDNGFGDLVEFEPDNIWWIWKRATSLQLNPPRPASFLIYDGGSDRENKGCPPVVDNDGNVIIP